MNCIILISEIILVPVQQTLITIDRSLYVTENLLLGYSGTSLPFLDVHGG